MTTEPPLEATEQARLYIEMWKQTISVQQHFNDICWRIRGLALTALTFALGAAALAARDPVDIRLLGIELQLSSVVTLAGLVLWQAFYYVDRRWYHRLLKGAVQHGEALEAELKRYLPEAGLTAAITASSSYDIQVFKLRTVTMDSSRKLRLFYLVVTGLLVAFALGLQFGGPVSRDSGTHIAPAGRLEMLLHAPANPRQYH